MKKKLGYDDNTAPVAII